MFGGSQRALITPHGSLIRARARARASCPPRSHALNVTAPARIVSLRARYARTRTRARARLGDTQPVAVLWAAYYCRIKHRYLPRREAMYERCLARIVESCHMHKYREHGRTNSVHQPAWGGRAGGRAWKRRRATSMHERAVRGKLKRAKNSTAATLTTRPSSQHIRGRNNEDQASSRRWWCHYQTTAQGTRKNRCRVAHQE